MSAKHHTVIAALLILAACSSGGHKPLATVDSVDLGNFMGDWYVISHTPTFMDKEAFNAIESYQLDERGRVLTTYTFNDGSMDGKQRRMHPVGFPRAETNNSVWGMQFVWPLRADYRIIYLDAEYTQTIIAREERDYAWIMARTPEIPEADYQRLVQMLETAGYDTQSLRRVPHRAVMN